MPVWYSEDDREIFRGSVYGMAMALDAERKDNARLRKEVAKAYLEAWYDGWDAANGPDAHQLDAEPRPHERDYDVSAAKLVAEQENQR
jgi:hypothetical protein